MVAISHYFSVISERFRYCFTGVRSLLIFILGIIVGAGGMLFLPELTSRREQLNEQMKKQLEVLEGQVRDLGDQLKKMNPAKPGEDQSKQPSATPSPTAK
jgi:hypothetical protein